MMMIKGDMFGNLGSCIGGLFFIWATYQQIVPDYIKIAIKEFFFQRFSNHFLNLFSPYVEINFPQYQESILNHAYTSINTYLVSKATDKAKNLRASQMRDSKLLDLKRDETTVNDEYEGYKVWWKIVTDTDGKKSYRLTFHNRARSVVTGSYIQYVVDEGKSIDDNNQKIKLFTSTPSWEWRYQPMWIRLTEFEHPASFQTLAMEPEKKQCIIDDLVAFSTGKEYYKKIGKTWKRVYFLFGPSGTGKSTMIAAMANLLNYNIFELKLATIQKNTDLMKLLTSTLRKSIIVIEDLDGLHINSISLSELLNFIDGLCSAYIQERIIVITNNPFVKKFDTALLRNGRINRCIEFTYCTYEVFKILAKNYLDVDDHPLFRKVKLLLEETNIVPADIAECLMTRYQTIDVDESLEYLIQYLEIRYRSRVRQTISDEHMEEQRSSSKKHKMLASLCLA